MVTFGPRMALSHSERQCLGLPKRCRLTKTICYEVQLLLYAVMPMLTISQGCSRDPDWPWWRQPLPWWLLPILVPTYAVASSLANMQKLWSWQLLVMVILACLAFTANKLGNIFLPDSGDLVSACGALIIGLLGNFYSRIVHGAAFTSMVTGILFLVPVRGRICCACRCLSLFLQSGIAEGGGLIDTDPTSTEQYSSGFSLAIRMIRVAIGITLGLFVSQMFVYALWRRKNAAQLAF